MTAITFPLKKFPGQMEHSGIVYTGRALTQLLLLALSTAPYGFLVGWEVDLKGLKASSPLVFVLLVQLLYIYKLRSRGRDYYSMSLDEMNACFGDDAKYFRQANRVGFMISLLSVVSSLCVADPSGRVRALSLYSSMVSMLYFSSIYRGAYTQRRMLVLVAEALVVESLYVFSWLHGAAVFSVLLALVSMNSYIRTIVDAGEYGAYDLLQNVIKE